MFYYQDSWQVSSVSPVFVLSSGGTRITLSGSGFSRRGDAQCRFGENLEPSIVTPTSYAYVISSEELICNVPPSGLQAGEFGSARVFLAASTNDFQWTGVSVNYVPVMVITFVRPRHIDEQGGQSLRIGGNNFPDLPGLACRFAGDSFGASVSALWISPTEVRCITPSLPPGKVLLDMTFNGKDFVAAPEMLEVEAKLTITAMSPLLGPKRGGTEVTITGTGFGSVYAIQDEKGTGHGLSCLFGDYAAFAIPASSEQITCYSPPGFDNSGMDKHGSVPVAIVRHHDDEAATVHSSRTVSTPFKFLYLRDMVLTAGKPDRGPSAGGTRVALTGLRDEVTFIRAAGVEPELRCRFGSVREITIFTTCRDEKGEASICCTSPPIVGNTLINATVSVSLNGGADFLPSKVQFYYYETPLIVSVSPSAVSVQGGTLVTLEGRHFPCTKKVECVFGSGSVSVEGTWVSSTILRCESPPHRIGFTTVSAVFNGLDVSPSAALLEYQEVLSISSISPSDAAVASGTEVTLLGTGFVNSSLLCFRWRVSSRDGFTVEPWYTSAVEFVNSTAAKFSAPYVAADDSEDVVVLELAISNNGLDFTRTDTTARLPIAGRPRVSDISPRYVSASGGVALSITGGGFVRTATSCRFGPRQLHDSSVSFTDDTVALIKAQVSNSTHLTCVTPEATPGKYFVEVVTGVRQNNASARNMSAASEAPDPRATAGFTIIHRYNLTSIEPMILPESGGIFVAIEGYNLTQTGLETCRFGGTKVVNATWWNSSLVTCEAPPTPPGVTAVELSLTAYEWMLVPVRVRFEPDRFVYSLTPTAGPSSGGSQVIVTGVGFADSSGGHYRAEFFCSFGGVEVSGRDSLKSAVQRITRRYIFAISRKTSTPLYLSLNLKGRP